MHTQRDLFMGSGLPSVPPQTADLQWHSRQKPARCLHPAQMRSVIESSFSFPRPLPFVPLLLILCVELTLSSLSLRQGFRPAICPSSHDSQERWHPRNLSWLLKILQGKGLKRISFAFLPSYHLQCE